MTDYSLGGGAGTVLSLLTDALAAGDRFPVLNVSDTTTAPAGPAGSDQYVTAAMLAQAFAALSGVMVIVVPSGDVTGAADTAAIQAALLSFGTLGSWSQGKGGIVFLQAAVYYINKTLILPSGVTLEGTGWGSQVSLVTNSGCDMIQWATYDSSSQATILGVSAAAIANAFYAGIKNLALHGDAFSATTPAYFHGINITTNPISTAAGGDPAFDPMPVVENVWIKACTGDGYYHENGRSGAFLKRVLVEDCNGNAYSLGTDTTAVDCLATGCTAGFYLNHTSNLGIGCKSYNNGLGQWVSGYSYTPGWLVISAGLMYWCILAVSGSTAPASDTAHWTELTAATAPWAAGYGYYFDGNAGEQSWAAADSQENCCGDYYFLGPNNGAISVDGTCSNANFDNGQPDYNAANPNHYASVTLDGVSGVNIRLSTKTNPHAVVCTSLNSPGSNTLVAVTDGTEAALFYGGTPSLAIVNGAVQSALTAKAGLLLTALTTKTSAYTISAATDFTILANAAGGAFSLTLPDATTCAGQAFFVKQTDTSTNVAAVLPHSGQTIDGGPGWDLGAYAGLVCISDGANFRTILAYGGTQNNTLDDGAGNMTIAGNLGIGTAGKGLKVKEGSNAKQGTATLSSGAVTVSNTSVTANSRIFLTVQSPGGTAGAPFVFSRSAGASFVIHSTSGSDSSTVAYEIFEPG